jgi:hypothetical protein
VACSVSSSVSRLHQLCTVLYNVALLYIEAKTQQNLVPMGNEFDIYLSQLGFMPSGANAGAGAGASANASAGGFEDGSGLGQQPQGAEAGGEDMEGVAVPGLNSQLGDWFVGNNYIMGLLEEDFSSINPAALAL